MKKLMVVAAIVCAAAMSQAATVSWQSAAKVNDGTGVTTAYADGMTAYLINAAELSRADFLTAFNTAGAAYASTISSLAKSSATLASSGKVGSTTDTGVSGFTSSAKTAYYVVFNGDKVMLSDELAGAYDSPNDKFTFQFKSTNQTGTRNTYKAADGLSSLKGGMAWYQAAPEPTSGLLLLLGVGALALRRRRA